jgi:hypothetical protein
VTSQAVPDIYFSSGIGSGSPSASSIALMRMLVSSGWTKCRPPSPCVPRHPFNVEPPPNALMERGFITPTSLHYVRNHGPVPKLSWDTHRLTVGALRASSPTMSMNSICVLRSASSAPAVSRADVQARCASSFLAVHTWKHMLEGMQPLPSVPPAPSTLCGQCRNRCGTGSMASVRSMAALTAVRR